MTFALRMVGVTKRFGHHDVLRGADLDLRRDETLAILGANGAGKSTLLRLAATLGRPTSGVIEILGHDSQREPEAARRRLAWVGQDAAVYDELTPMQHLAWWGRLHRLNYPEKDRLEDLEDAGLERVAYEPARHLSRGQRQRLALAIGFHADPALLILDEPSNGLDKQGTAWLDHKLEWRWERTATIVATHDESHARKLADRVLRLANGRLETMVGDPGLT